jgi:subtilisin-like proprotein convertase family protein
MRLNAASGRSITLGALIIVAGLAATASAQVKISQINTAGGTNHSWAGPTANYIELHNTGSSDADLTGWAIQTVATTGTTWLARPFPAGFTIPAHRYALVQIGTAGTPLNNPNNTGDVAGFVPAADLIVIAGGVSPAASKIALTSSAVVLSGACPTSDPSVVDYVGFGSTDCFNGAPAPGMNNFNGLALYRGCDGNTDTDNDAADFSLALSSPRNLASPPDMGALIAVGAPVESTPVSIVQNSAVLLTATASSCSGAVTGLSFTANLSFVGGPSAATMYDDGTHGDAVAGDGTFSLSYTVPESLLPAPPPGPNINRPYVVPISATDSLGRSAKSYAAFYVTAAPTGACCVGGQVSVRTQASCVSLGGTYKGDNSLPFSSEGTEYMGGAIAIPDPGTATGSITIPDATIINGLIVHLTGYHSFLGDLRCTLSNGASTVTLFDHVGIAGNNATGRPGNLVNGYMYAFTDGGASFWNAAYNGGKDTAYSEPAGYYAPSGPQNAPSSFAPFIGQSARGTWTLSVTDSRATDSGFLFSWSIEINPTPACTRTCSADFNCDGDVGTDADIESFFSCLAGTCPAAPCMSGADFNGDGDVGTDADIESFFRVLGGGAC